MSAADIKYSKRNLIRIAAMLVAGVEILFWIYTFFYISQHANPLGDGMEMVAVVPMTIIAVFLAFPAFALSISGRTWWLAASFALAAAVANGVVWAQVLGELR